jgi:hypothetical protein
MNIEASHLWQPGARMRAVLKDENNLKVATQQRGKAGQFGA